MRRTSAKLGLSIRTKQASWSDGGGASFGISTSDALGSLRSQSPRRRRRFSDWKGGSNSTHVKIEFETSDAAKKAYASLVRAFEALRASNRIWDITSDRAAHRVIERTTASRTLTRNLVTVDFSTSDLVRFEGRPMRFQNINGEDILFYPGVAIMPRSDGAFALIDLRELRLEFTTINSSRRRKCQPIPK